MSTAELGLYVDKIDELMNMIGKTFRYETPHGYGNEDLTHVQFHLLYLLVNNDNATMTDLSRWMGTTLGNITMLVDRLVRDNYVLRGVDPDDRRIVRIKLSEKSRKTVQKILGQKRKFMLHVLDKLSAVDRKNLLRILSRLAEALNSERGKT